MGFTLLEQQLSDAIQWSLENHIVTNAVFLAERLMNETSQTTEDKEAKQMLLAKCYLAENSPHKAVILLRHSNTDENRYLYALSCFQAGMFEDAERALNRTSATPQGAAGLYLLGQICDKQARIQEAANYYSKALQQNPQLWVAFEKLCKYGCQLNVEHAFRGEAVLKENSSFFHSPVQSPSFYQPLSSSYIDNWAHQPNPNAKLRGMKELSDLLTEMGKGLQLLTRFEVDEALNQLLSLPDNQKNSSWALCQIAKCHFEKYDFQTSIEYFQRAFREEPQRVEDTDIYSTALWYEKRATDLCYLLHNLLKRAYHSPQTWVISGNFYSLQKDRETSIKCFTRAIQLNPYYSYAYALCGHEYLGSEDYEQAKAHYEAAKNMDPRSYTAHWGLGSLYYKQEKYSQSLICYKQAKSINPRSSILLTYLGVNLKTLGQYQEAIDCYTQAIKLDKKNPLPRFQLGILLSLIDRDQEALEQLEALREESPRESHLYIQIGKIYAKMQQQENALKYYNIAQDLNPKNQTDIKNLIEQLHGTPNFPIIPQFVKFQLLKATDIFPKMVFNDWC